MTLTADDMMAFDSIIAQASLEELRMLSLELRLAVIEQSLHDPEKEASSSAGTPSLSTDGGPRVLAIIGPLSPPQFLCAKCWRKNNDPSSWNACPHCGGPCYPC